MLAKQKKPLIGKLREKSLHAELKTWYKLPGDQVEAVLNGSIIDILRPGEAIEIQTKNFSSIRPKLENLLEHVRVRLVYPLAVNKWIVRINMDGKKISRRRSPKRGRLEDIFDELVYIPHLLLHPDFTFEVVFVDLDELWRDDGQGSWRRKGWSIYDRRLIRVQDTRKFTNRADYLSLLPKNLELPFTNHELQRLLGIQMRSAQRMTNTLRKAGILAEAGKRGREKLFTLAEENGETVGTSRL